MNKRAPVETTDQRRIKALERYIAHYPMNNPPTTLFHPLSHTQGKPRVEEEEDDESIPTSQELQEAMKTDPEVVSISLEFVQDAIQLLHDNPGIQDLGLEEEERQFLSTLVHSLLETKQYTPELEDDLKTILQLTQTSRQT